MPAQRLKTALAAAFATAAGGVPASAEAATWSAELTQVLTYRDNGISTANITSSSAIWSLNDDNYWITQVAGTFNARYTTGPSTTLYRTSTTGLVIRHGGAASANTYQCVEGNFGVNVGVSLCGNYNFGANFVNESTSSWGPGVSVSRSLQGDDAAVGPVQSVASLDGMNFLSYVAFNMVFSNATCTATCTTAQGGFNRGQRWTFRVLPFPEGPGPKPPPTIPIPAAAWLFGSALAVLGMARRRDRIPGMIQHSPTGRFRD